MESIPIKVKIFICYHCLMKLIQTMIHPKVQNLEGTKLEREAVRAIALKGESILLLYTKRYNDYSLPGGGLDAGESLEDGLVRELEEETGAQGIQILKNLGHLEEYRPYHKPEYDIVHMISHLFLCDVDVELGETQMEDYEHKNGMEPVWINIHEAIAHNQAVMDQQEKSMGLSIERETFVLRKIVAEVL